MKGWSIPHYGNIEDLSLDEHNMPTCLENQVLVRVKAVALNPADLKLISGKDGGKFLHASNFPIVPGFDFSGTIEQVGENVRDLRLEQEVFGFLPYAKSTKQGSLSEYLVVHPKTISPKPANVTHQEAAGMATVGTTALVGLRDKGMLIGGQHILINGASGGVGSVALQIAKHRKAKVWGICSAKNMAFVRNLGAEDVFDYQKISIKTLDRKFDVIFDVASTSSFTECVSKLKTGGIYITLLPSLSIVTGMLRSFLIPKSNSFVVARPKSENLAQLASWMAGGHIKTPIAFDVKFKDAPTAFKKLQKGVAGKVVISMD